MLTRMKCGKATMLFWANFGCLLLPLLLLLNNNVIHGFTFPIPSSSLSSSTTKKMTTMTNANDKNHKVHQRMHFGTTRWMIPITEHKLDQECQTQQQEQQRHDDHDNDDGDDHDLVVEKQRIMQKQVWEYILQRFQGDFDNYEQVVNDRQQSLLPREGGGHENFHCTLVPVTKTDRLAAFYFDGNPQRIFRFRYYKIILPNENDDGHDADKHRENDKYDNEPYQSVEMKLYTLHPALEKVLRESSEEPMEWSSIYATFQKNHPSLNCIEYLPNCEIQWRLRMDPIQHSYLSSSASASASTNSDSLDTSNDDDDGIHAVMVHGEAIVDSTIIPGMKIRILDQLSLYDDIFYINDRGLDPITGAYIYGNQRGVPYRLQRVSNIVYDHNDKTDDGDDDDDDDDNEIIGGGRREIVKDELQWTLGTNWRTEKEYQTKIDSIGGPSAGMSRKKK